MSAEDPFADDRKLRREFGLPEDTDTLLPIGTSGRFIVKIGCLSPVQARTILQAAKDAGIKLNWRDS